MLSYIIEQYIYFHIPEFEYALGKRNGEILNHRMIKLEFTYTSNVKLIDKIDLKTFKKFAFKFYENNFATLFTRICFKNDKLLLKKWLWKFITLDDFNNYERDTLNHYERCKSVPDLQFHFENIVTNPQFPNDMMPKLMYPCKNLNIIKYFYDRNLVSLDRLSTYLRGIDNTFDMYDVIDFICNINDDPSEMIMVLFFDNNNILPTNKTIIYALQRSNFACKERLFKKLIQCSCSRIIISICERLGKITLTELDHEMIYNCNKDMLQVLEQYCGVNLNDYVDKEQLLRYGHKISIYFYERTSDHRAWRTLLKRNLKGFHQD